MATNDTCCTIVPYFQVQSGRLEEFKALCERFVAKTEEEPDCLYYGFCFDDHIAHCREGYGCRERWRPPSHGASSGA